MLSFLALILHKKIYPHLLKLLTRYFIYVTTIYIRSSFSIQFYFDYPSTPPFCEEMLADITRWSSYQVLVAGYGAP